MIHASAAAAQPEGEGPYDDERPPAPAPAPASTPAPPAPAPTGWKLPGGPDVEKGVARPEEASSRTEESGIEAEDVGLFVPRAILFLPRMVLRLLYFPLQKGIRFVEEHYIIEEVVDTLYNDERTAAIIPLLSISSDYGPVGGVRAFHDDLGGHGEKGSITAKLGGEFEQAYELHFEADRTGGSRFWLESHTSFEVQPHMRFFGLGDPEDPITEGTNLDPRTASVETRFRHQRFRHALTGGITIGDPGSIAKIGTTMRLKRHDFGPGERLASGDVSIDSVYDTAQVPGFDVGATITEVEANLVVDTRDKAGATSEGAYLTTFAGGGLPFRQYEYFRYGAELVGYIDLWRETRVLVLRGAIHAVEGQEEEIPFVELPSLGGPHRLRGYSLHRFRDKKMLLGTAEYHYPIHQLLAGSLYVDVGEVARTYEGLVSDPQVHVGGGGGFIIRSEDNILLTLDVAYGDGIQVYATTDPLRAFADLDDSL